MSEITDDSHTLTAGDPLLPSQDGKIETTQEHTVMIKIVDDQ